jgi:predicted RNA binding protein YcfA (HicA-like mRNA interferase family)
MPPKVRELIAELERAGFVDRGGKGSHRNHVHPRLSKPITISGKLGMTRSSTKSVPCEALSRRSRSEGN